MVMHSILINIIDTIKITLDFFFIILTIISISIMKLIDGGALMLLAIIISHNVACVLDCLAVLAVRLFFVFCCSVVEPAIMNIMGEISPCASILIIDDFFDQGIIDIMLTSINIMCLTDEYAIIVFLSDCRSLRTVITAAPILATVVRVFVCDCNITFVMIIAP